ncbi:uncharacterized protein KY384_001635 [Bacidia gigantensis]|uniref:uncharacterized protein n=1 Tax=Bacidia gigantensis TaxID=2732470 RepID=UPI001D046BF3|nr:uncharacterized protein KY384_001635 [Bacidia gigantensis]KAG8533894.1 hypothetical protein KY384_001635 [Bacidia gigantensis]
MASTTTALPATAPHLLNLNNFEPQLAPQTTLQASKTKPGRKDVTADFNYYLDPGDGSEPSPTYVGKPETYFRPADTRSALVHDIRGEEDKYSLDTTGFQIFHHSSNETAFEDDEHIKEVYYPEIEHILKTATGASQIFIFDHTIRRQPADARNPDPNQTKAAQTLCGPVQRVHIDQSYTAAPQRVTHHLPEQAERLLKGRFQIINVWRPIKTIRKDPLGVADANSVPDEDLLPVKLIYPDRVGETFTVRPGKAGEAGEGRERGHSWFYLREQTPGEVMLIKCFDSKTDGRARRVPHSAFVDESTEHEEPRESIEVRALVFHPDDTE